MSEETAERLNDGDSFETRVSTALTAINGQHGSMNVRLTALEKKVDTLEEKVDVRLRETRPIWESVMKRLDVIDAKFDVFAREMLEIKADIALPPKRQPPAA